MINKIRGTHDILPQEAALWVRLEEKARDLFTCFGFHEIRPPIMEWTELFARGIGQATDIVEKEMYSFTDSQGRSVSLRPEATAGVLRCYLENKLYAQKEEHKLFTIGPMFRHERPQKGRYRQFHQINADVIGNPGPRVDAELIVMLYTFLSRVGVTDMEVVVNSLGCPDCRPPYREKLVAFLVSRREALCADCRRRVSLNPLRVLDCKVPSCREAVRDAPSLRDHYCAMCGDHFRLVLDGLDRFSIPHRVDARLVRGLDYYTRTAFEVVTTGLGSQDSVAGGGRYDGLAEVLGGPPTPAIGFAVGMERLALVTTLQAAPARPRLFIAALGNEALEQAFTLANRLRLTGVGVEVTHAEKSLKSQMRRADKLQAFRVMIIGEAELRGRRAVIRDMDGGGEREVSLDLPMEELAALVR